MLREELASIMKDSDDSKITIDISNPSGDSSSYEDDSLAEERARQQMEAEQKTRKGCIGCMTVFIVLFVMLLAYCSWDMNTNYERTKTGKLRPKTSYHKLTNDGTRLYTATRRSCFVLGSCHAI